MNELLLIYIVINYYQNKAYLYVKYTRHIWFVFNFIHSGNVTHVYHLSPVKTSISDFAWLSMFWFWEILIEHIIIYKRILSSHVKFSMNVSQVLIKKLFVWKVCVVDKLMRIFCFGSCFIFSVCESTSFCLCSLYNVMLKILILFHCRTVEHILYAFLCLN